MTYVKNARHLVTVARGFEPKPGDAARLITNALAHALHQARHNPDDAVAQLRDSFETIEAAGMQSSAPPAPVPAPAAEPVAWGYVSASDIADHGVAFVRHAAVAREAAGYLVTPLYASPPHMGNTALLETLGYKL